MPYTATSCADALAEIKNNCVPECEFRFITDKTTGGNFELMTPTAAKAILCGVEGSILDVYGTGEYKFDKFNVYLYLHRGTDTGVQIRYGKNLVDMTDELDSSGSYTAVVPFWTNPETGEVKTLPEWAVLADDAPVYFDYWTNEQGRRITDENNNEFEFAYTNITAVSLDLSSAFSAEPTDEQMREKAKDSANAHKLYTQSLSIDFVQLAQSEEYKDFAPLLELNLCDTCEVVYNGNPVRLKVIRTEYDALRDRYAKIDLGDPPANYADIIMGEIADTTPTRTEVTTAIRNASDLIKGVNGGNVVFRYRAGKPYEILIMDTDDVATAVNVLRINMNGIGFSHTGVDGEYATAWTLDGTFVADFIQAGTLSGTRIRGGILSALDGASYWDLNNSRFVNAGPNGSVKFDNGGINFYAPGDIYTGTIAPTRTISSNEYGIGVSVAYGRKLTFVRDNEDPNGVRYVTFQINNDPNATYAERILLRAISRCTNRLYFGTETNQNYSSYVQDGVVSIDSVDKHIFSIVGEHGVVIGTHLYHSVIASAYTAGYRIFINEQVWFATIYTTHFGGAVEAYGFNNLSDENLKNIYAYNDEYDRLLDDLEPITYTWKGRDGGEHVGLGARRTRQIIEDHGLVDSGLVTNNNDVYSIDYADLTAMLLKRVQDQTKQIKDLSARLERLEAILANS